MGRCAPPLFSPAPTVCTAALLSSSYSPPRPPPHLPTHTRRAASPHRRRTAGTSPPISRQELLELILKVNTRLGGRPKCAWPAKARLSSAPDLPQISRVACEAAVKLRCAPCGIALHSCDVPPARSVSTLYPAPCLSILTPAPPPPPGASGRLRQGEAAQVLPRPRQRVRLARCALENRA